MAKRFTDNQKWAKPFIRGLKAPYKLLWLYILDECDHAGIWQIDFDVARIRIGIEEIDLEGAKKSFGDKIMVFDGDEKMFIQDFIDFQYGTLNPENRAHNSVISILVKYKIAKKNKGLISSLQGCKDKDKDMDMDKGGEPIKFYRQFLHLKISFEENEKLKEMGYSQKQVDEIFDSIQNYKANTKYSSLYLTSIKWLKKEFPNVVKQENKYTEEQIRKAKNYWTMDRILPDYFDKNDLHLIE